MKPTIALFLEEFSNAYMQVVHAEAEREAQRCGLQVKTSYADSRFLQIQQLFSAIHQPRERPIAIAVLPLVAEGLGRVARAALRRGMDWIYLHRRGEDIGALRREFPNNAITLVAADHAEIGRQQGRLAKAIAPDGGALYVHGGRDMSSTRDRFAGFCEWIDPERQICGIVDGNWTAQDARSAIAGWLGIMAPSLDDLHVVVCQNDMMAMGAAEALAAQGERLGRPGLAELPVIGCDGVAQVGRRLVDERKLAATVVLEGIGREVVRVVANRLKRTLPPEERILWPRAYSGPSRTPSRDPEAREGGSALHA